MAPFPVSAGKLCAEQWFFFPTTDLDPKAAISMQSWNVDENYIPNNGYEDFKWP